MGGVAHGRGLSQKIAQLLINTYLDYIFIPTRRELNSLTIYVVYGLWFHVMQVGRRLDAINWTRRNSKKLNKAPKFF